MSQVKSIEEVLHFLSLEYKTYDKQSEQDKLRIDRWNTAVQDRHQSTDTLRDLYIQLMLYDNMLGLQTKSIRHNSYMRHHKSPGQDSTMDKLKQNKHLIIQHIKRTRITP